jgi:anti-sigma factor RsiW
MTCHDVRDLFSALADQALEPLQRGQVDQHLSACADCRRELDRFERTVGALRRLGPEGAPVGFVDRVLGAVRPEPWHRRLLRRLFVPLRVKVPVEAMALILAAAAAVYVFERSPELERAAPHEESPPGVSSPIRPAAPAVGTGPPSAGRSQAPDPPKAARQRTLADDTGSVAPRQKAEDQPAPATPETAREESHPAAAPERAASMPLAPAAVGRDEPSKKEGRRSSELDATAKTAAPPTSVGLLTVKDRRAAETALAELLARLDAEEVSRRAEQDHTLVEILVSGDRYRELAEGLERIGVWSIEREPERGPQRIPVRVRISE